MARPLRKFLGPWALAIGQHHERWDGHGYPRGLSEKKISRAARIVAVADAFDVMTAARSYRRPMRAEAARRELAACAGRDFDPEVVRAFLDISIGRVRWALGLSGLFALPFLPRNATQPARNTAAGGMAAAVALAAGLLPLQAAPATQVLGESFVRRPQISTPPSGTAPEPAPVAGEPAPPTPTTMTTPTPQFAVVTTTTTIAAPSVTVASAPLRQVAVDQAVTTTTTTTAASPTPAIRVAVDDTVAAPVKGPIRIDVLGNDSEPGGTLVPKSVSIVSPPLHGTAKADKDGRVHYDPSHNYVGPDSFVYSVCDTVGRCFTATVTLTVSTH